MTPNDWITLAVIGPPHGVSGRVKVKSLTEPEDDFARHSALTYADGTPLKLKITGHAQGMAIVSIEGITDRNQAELLRGKKLGVPRSALPELKKPDQFYVADLIGMHVLDANGGAFGTVDSVANYGASDILEILRPNGVAELYAFTAATFPNVDRAARRITIDPPIILGSRIEEQSSNETT
jgi:16S rRNA processing protein RimM